MNKNQNKWDEFYKREREREEMTVRLIQQNREINQNLKDLGNWGERVMAKILAPLRNI